jgi:hypothetical protein
MARPIPRLAPVTSALFPASCRSIVGSLHTYQRLMLSDGSVQQSIWTGLSVRFWHKAEVPARARLRLLFARERTCRRRAQHGSAWHFCDTGEVQERSPLSTWNRTSAISVQLWVPALDVGPGGGLVRT